MIIKVDGMREPENIREVTELGVDMIGLDFRKESSRYVGMVSSNAGFIPDYSVYSENENCTEWGRRVGVFADDMPQNIITRIYNYHLDCVQLNGGESRVMIENLRSTVVPDISKKLTIIKTLRLADENDVMLWREYADCADMLLFCGKGDEGDGCVSRFDWHLLSAYDGNIPFIIGGGIVESDAAEIKKINHPMFAGIDLDEGFETQPAVKDVSRIRHFIDELTADITAENR